MRRFSREFGHSYETYSFGYTNWALKEPEDKLSDIYTDGFLPYSGDIHAHDMFYMARSIRIPLKNFELTSENKRIAKRHDGLYEREEIPKGTFDTGNSEFIQFCLSYFQNRHGNGLMPETRLRFILDSNILSHIVSYKKDGVVIAYVFEAQDPAMTHFWYSFYDLSYVKQSLGLWLMIESARYAQKRGAHHLYLGTAYGDKGLYKTNFEPLEFWDGSTWIYDTKKLRTLCKSDT